MNNLETFKSIFNSNELNLNIPNSINLNQYNYPFDGIKINDNKIAIEHYKSIREMENKIKLKFESNEPLEILEAYLSIIFWGHLSTSKNDGKTNPKRALSKLPKIFKNNGDIDTVLVNFIQTLIKSVLNEISNKNYDSAVAIATLLPNIGFSFATKIIAFMNPEDCGVLDSKIAEKLGLIDTKLEVQRSKNATILKSTLTNFIFYKKYCIKLNESAEKSIDTEGKYKIRSVDVERFIFTL